VSKKIKILTLSDHPLSPSGVGTQTKYMIESLLKTGKYQFVSLGGAVKHQDYQPIRIEEWGDEWSIYPVDGYGTQDIVRSIIRTEKPDILWFMTDPRFWGWLWEMEDEIRCHMPMVYYHVWDNYPYPDFNKFAYESNDTIACISKVTYDIVKNVAPEVDTHYLPHAVNPDIFKKHDEEEVQKFRDEFLSSCDGKKIYFWNNRNARRKQSGTLIFWFNDFLDKVGRDKAVLIMHTDPRDQYGQDLQAILNNLKLNNGEVIFSVEKLPPEQLSMLYNTAHCTINISDAEGFGLATLESLSCETPIAVSMTGGLQEQVTDGEHWFGEGIQPSSKAIIGSQDIPYIYEDRLNRDEFISALVKIHKLSKKKYSEMGKRGRAHVIKNYNFEDFGNKWDKLLTKVNKNSGSWKERKNYKTWTIKEVA
jgi:glycosyltransferase involved in cell wall biosynthesis